MTSAPAVLAGSAVVNFAELAQRQALAVLPPRRVRPEESPEPEAPAEPAATPSPEALITPPPFVPYVSSPSPIASFAGLDDIAMVDSNFIVIPPDCDGAVGLTKILTGLNNNYRVLDKSNGAVLSTVGTATFWAATNANTSLTDPHTLYDPYNHRWIVCMISDWATSSSAIEVGVSQTSDPMGNWFLFRTVVGTSTTSVDFPIMGFNKNWVVITVNQHSNSNGAFRRGQTLVVDYPQLRSGTFSGTLFTQASNTHFCSGPCVTYSSTSDTLYLVTHGNSGGATYTLDRITGTPSSPNYSFVGGHSRPGGGWVQPGGNLLPQSQPQSGTSACGSVPCPLSVFDAQVRSAPVYRGGAIYYTQTIGLPSSGLTHTAVQWTKITTPTGVFVDGGRIEDPTATSTNGGKWYAFSHIAVNSIGDFIVGFTQCASNQHPSAGYAVHQASDPAGSIRDVRIHHAGEDYYHKTFSTTTGRNRWGDYSKAQVDPADDRSLWVVDEYAKARVGTDDGNSGANSSRWGTWWSKVPGSGPLAVPRENDLLGFGLSAIAPIPTTGPLHIEYKVGRQAPVRLSIEDLQGRTVAVIAEDVQEPGRHVAVWRPRDALRAGVYFVSYSALGRTFTRRVVVTR